jgi:DNA-binding phage protein
MKHFDVEDVIALLRREIDRVGGQSEWARQTGVGRADINRVLNGRRLPATKLCVALGLKWVVERQVSTRGNQLKPVIISNRDVLEILGEVVKNAGGVAAWSRDVGVSRTYLSLVLHGRKPPGRIILAALNLSEILVADRSHATRPRRHQNASPSRRLPHARW